MQQPSPISEKDPEKLFSALTEKAAALGTAYNAVLISNAYNYAATAHQGQKRVSGEDYICHPLEVALIIAEMALDSETIAAGILHDTIEDTDTELADIKSKFGDDVAMMVDGVTKLGKIHFTSHEEAQIENLRKMFLAMAKDVRVMMIKLADRLHNMRTMDVMPDVKRRTKAKETIEVYAPIAHRLGMFKIKAELEDLSLKYLDPYSYNDIVTSVGKKIEENKHYIDGIIETLKHRLPELGINANIYGRVKHYYSIYRKTIGMGNDLDEIYDIFAVRVVVDTVADCYTVLGLVHDMYKPIPGRIKDYIAMPKPNMYQSLHSTVMGTEGTPFEIQIRTWDMHRVAEYGIAAHWKYKEGKSSREDIDSKLAWIRQLLELQGDLTDDEEFLRALKVDLFADEVFVFTPKGDVISLPAGAGSIDFAYAIHSAVGNKMLGAKVNGKLVPLEHALKNGDIVDILTTQSVHGPSRDWLKIVKTSNARNKINQWFKKERRDENIQQGRDSLEKEIKRTGYSSTQLMSSEIISAVLKKHNFNNIEDLYSAIGYGGITANKIASRLKEEYKKQHQEQDEPLQPITHQKSRQTSSNGIIVKGIENCLVKLSRCCSPVPGDSVIGYITRGRGVSVHRRDCVNVVHNFIGDGQSDRLIDVEWSGAQSKASYSSELLIIAYDRKGLLSDITGILTNMRLNVSGFNARTNKEMLAHITITLEITDASQLDSVINKLKTVVGVSDVIRNMQ